MLGSAVTVWCLPAPVISLCQGAAVLRSELLLFVYKEAEITPGLHFAAGCWLPAFSIGGVFVPERLQTGPLLVWVVCALLESYSR